MKEFDLNRLELRNKYVQGVGPWVWIKEDQYTFDHPAHDFPLIRGLILGYGTGPCEAIVCAGGALGMYPRLWAEDFKTVYAFEPSPLNFHCMVMNCPSPDIIKMNAALGDSSYQCGIYPGPVFNPGMDKITHPGESEAANIPVLPLDAFNFRSLSAIQLDVESHELFVLNGAQQTIAKHRPVISVEGDVPEVRQFLDDRGYVEIGRRGHNPDVVYIDRSRFK